jgi:hypothetical protein
MAQTTPIGHPIDPPAAFDDEIAKAETAFALSSVTAKILGYLSASSRSSATQLMDPTNGLPAIAKSAMQLTDPTNGLPAIAKSAMQLTDPTNGLPAIAKSATQLTDPTNGLPAIAKEIATTICNLANVTIAGRGDSKCPVHVTIGDDQSLQVTFGQQTTDAVRELLRNLSDIAKNTSTIAATISNWPNPTIVCADLKHQLDELAKDFRILQEHYRNHYHERSKTLPISDVPAKNHEGNNPDLTKS